MMLIHYSVYFLERDKASPKKAAAILFIVLIVDNIFSPFEVSLPEWSQWIISITMISVLVWWLFRLKPYNVITVATVYVVGVYAKTYLLSYIPLEVINA